MTADQLKVSLYSYEHLGHDHKWYVPFTFITDYDTEPNCLWMNKTDGKFDVFRCMPTLEEYLSSRNHIFTGSIFFRAFGGQRGYEMDKSQHQPDWFL